MDFIIISWNLKLEIFYAKNLLDKKHKNANNKNSFSVHPQRNFLAGCLPMMKERRRWLRLHLKASAISLFQVKINIRAFLYRLVFRKANGCHVNQEGSGQWTVYYTSPWKFYNNVILFVDLITLGTFIDFIIIKAVHQFIGFVLSL